MKRKWHLYKSKVKDAAKDSLLFINMLYTNFYDKVNSLDKFWLNNA